MRLVSLPSVLLLSAAFAGFHTLSGQDLTYTSAESTAHAAPAPTPIAIPTHSTPTQWHETEVPQDKLISAEVRDGMLVIDDWVAKVHLNYEIRDQGYLYFFVPGVGTVLVSRVQMPDAELVPNAFDGAKLSFAIGGHTFQLTGKRSLLLRDKHHKDIDSRADVYVRLDTSALNLDRNPMMGYGTTTLSPYEWPLSLPGSPDTYKHFVTPPPIPSSMLPYSEATVREP